MCPPAPNIPCQPHALPSSLPPSLPAIPGDEAQRLARLQSLGVLDTPREERCDRIVRLAAQLFGVPIAAISLLDERRQWFKSCVGLTLCETPREHAFCSHAILHSGCFVVPDARTDPRFARNPLVLGPPHIRFYAGAPIRVDGHAVGSLCVIDRVEHQPDPSLLRSLEDLADVAAEALRHQEEASRFAAACGVRSSFLSVLSHEMRTPLGAVLGYTDMLKDELTAPERGEAVAGIGRNAERLFQLVEDLLELVQLEGGGCAPSITLLRPERLLREICHEFELRASERGLRFEASVRIDPETVISADPRQLRRAIASLLDNAMKFSEAGGAVRLQASIDAADPAAPNAPNAGASHALRVRIVDEGIGLPPGDIEQLFQPFMMGDATLTRRFGGAGTGLAIARHFARANGGDVQLERVNHPTGESRRGTIATVAFRVAIQPATPEWSPAGSPAGSRATPRPAPRGGPATPA